MKEVRDAILVVLREDAAVAAAVGTDADEFVKVYETQAAPNTEAPFVVVQRIDAAEPAGHFGDVQAMEAPVFQVTSWGRAENQMWDIVELVEEALLDEARWGMALADYDLLRIRRAAGGVQLQDPDTGWHYFTPSYRVDMAR